ncbi:hypothetical protein Emed_007419 [Eimeria media]
MVDDETSSQSSNHSGMQLRSRKLTKPPSSRRGEGGVAALIMSHGPSMTSEDDGSLPSANSHTQEKSEDNEPFEIITNKKKELNNNASQQQQPQKCTADLNEATQMQHMMNMILKLTMRLEQQSHEQERHRQLVETLLHSKQQLDNSETRAQTVETTKETSKETAVALNQLPSSTHVIWTPRYDDAKNENNSTRYDKPKQSLVNKFNGQNPVQWINVLEFEFTQWNVPEKERYNRALTLMEEQILHRYLIEKGDYETTWEGIKKFVSTWYGQAEEHTVREKFKRLRWKGSVEQLDKDLRAALDVCTTIPDVDLTSTFVALIPEGMRAYWISKRSPDDRYRHTVTICLDYERVQHQWMQRSYVQTSAAAYGDPSRGPKTQQRQQRDNISRTHNNSINRQIPPDRLSPCRHCKGKGHYSQACANLRGTKANENTECFMCKGKGHFAKECANNLANGGKESTGSSKAEPQKAQAQRGERLNDRA